MKTGPIAHPLVCSLAGLFILALGLTGSGVLSAHDQPQGAALAHWSHNGERMGPLVKAVREATRRFQDPAVADAEGYKEAFGCVSGSDAGAMGVHLVNMPLVMDPALDVTRPEIVIYEPGPDGRLRLIGADYLVFAGDWHTQNGPGTPELMGQLFHLFESPNRFGLPAFYTLHVWAWKENPNGAFVNWHPDVTCNGFRRQN